MSIFPWVVGPRIKTENGDWPFDILHQRSGRRTVALGERFSGFDALNMGAAMIMVLLWLASRRRGERKDGTGTGETNGACEGKS